MSFEAFIQYVAIELKAINIILPSNHPMWLLVGMAWKEGQHPDDAVKIVRQFYDIVKEGTH